MRQDRVAAAPISWGVSEVPEWGYQLPADRVLDEMRQLGLTATEFGPDGFLAAEPAAKAGQLRAHGLRAVGGFLPIVLHDPDDDPLSRVAGYVDDCRATGADVAVLAAATGVAGYDERPSLDELGWETLLHNLDRIHDLSRAHGVVASLHPHVGTMIERGDEVDRVLAGSRVGLCVDTGHLLAAGTDPVALTEAHVDRVVHVHLKDVDGARAADVAAGRTPFGAAVRDGLFQPLGRGTVDISAMIRMLDAHGYPGWYVLEQDIVLAGEPTGAGPIDNVRVSLDYLERMTA